MFLTYDLGGRKKSEILVVLDFDEGRTDFDEGRTNFDEGRMDFDEGQTDFDEGRTDFDEGTTDERRNAGERRNGRRTHKCEQTVKPSPEREAS